MKKLSTAFLFLFIFMNVSTALFAANYDIKRMTPEIEQAFQNRKERYETLQNLKAQGAVGEDRQGLVQALQNEPANALVQAENRDRETIYRAIVEQNELGPNGMAQVRMVFADVQRDKARPGDMIQSSSGAWAKK